MFKVVKFDNNNDADAACKELFADPVSKKAKNRVKKGKITKIAIKKKSDFKDEEKLKDEIRAILQSNVDSIKATKNKISREKQNKSVVQENANQTKSFLENKQNFDNAKQQKEGKKHKKRNLQKVPKPVVLLNNGDNTISQKKRKKRKKKFLQETTKDDQSEDTKSEIPLDYKQKKKEKLKEKLQRTLNPLPQKKEKSKNLTLRERMMAKLQSARFRYINEQIYSSDSKEAKKIFTEDPEAFEAYHEGYRQQVNKWPLNPVDVIIKSIQSLPKTHIIADFGCGDAKLAKSVSQKVHSFDLVASNDLVTACDMAHAPLQNGSVDVVVFCLSLMGTNLHDYLLEANRVLKLEGILKIAEVESRFEDVNQFIEALKRFNFKNTWSDVSHNLFYFLDFKKEANVKNKKKLPRISLNPCLYKKR